MPNIDFQITGTPDDAVRAFTTIEGKQRALQEQQKRLGRESAQAANAMSSGFDGAVKKLAALAAGYVSVTYGIRKVIEALKEEDQIRRDAADANRRRYHGFAALAQLPGDTRRMVADAKRSMAETGMDEREAGELQFMLESTGQQAARETFARMYPAVSPSRMVGAVKKYRTAFGEKETGGAGDILSKIFVAAGQSVPKAEEVLERAAWVAPSAKVIGASDEETLAYLSSFMNVMSPEVAGTALRALSNLGRQRQMGLPGDKGFTGIVQELKRRNLSPKQYQKLFAEMDQREVVGLVNALQQVDTIPGLIKEIQEATAPTPGGEAKPDVTQVIKRRLESAFPAERTAEKIATETTIKREEAGSESLQVDAINNLLSQAMSEVGANFAQKFLARRAMGVARLTGATPKAQRDYAIELLRKLAPLRGGGKSDENLDRAEERFLERSRGVLTPEAFPPERVEENLRDAERNPVRQAHPNRGRARRALATAAEWTAWAMGSERGALDAEPAFAATGERGASPGDRRSPGSTATVDNRLRGTKVEVTVRDSTSPEASRTFGRE